MKVRVGTVHRVGGGAQQPLPPAAPTPEQTASVTTNQPRKGTKRPGGRRLGVRRTKTPKPNPAPTRASNQ